MILFSCVAYVVNMGESELKAPLLKPFTLEVWLGGVGIFVVTALFLVYSMTLFNNMHNNQQLNYRRISTASFTSMSDYIYAIPFQQRKHKLWRRWQSTRLLICVWSAMAKTAITMYAAVFVSNFVHQSRKNSMEPPFRDMQGLANLVRDQRITMYSHYSQSPTVSLLLRDSVSDEAQALREAFKANPLQNFTNGTNADLFNFVQNTPKTGTMGIESHMESMLSSCDVHLVIDPDPFMTITATVAVPKNMTDQRYDELAAVLHELRDFGHASRFSGLYTSYKRCLKTVKQPKITLNSLTSVFTMYSLGIAMSVLLISIEKFK